MPRRYDVSTYKKHKRPQGWGSLCPDEISLTDAQVLLGCGVEVDGAIWNVEGRHCFRAYSHDREGEDSLWHGHPIPWSRLPTEARRRLIDAGRLDPITYRKALRQRWGIDR